MEKFYITTAIPYVNAAPHLGHVLEFLQADAIARYQKSRGKEVALVTGADENSLKNVQAAEKHSVTVSALCERNSEIFREMAHKVGLSFTSFRRTSDRKKHWPGVQEIWKLCGKRGDVYKKKYRGLYCVGCEAFYEPGELQDGACPEHKTKPEEIEEENYFFRLSKYQGELERLVENDELKIVPETRKNEVLSFIKGGLKDFSISRSVARAKGWGVPVPDDPNQIEYVWFDALGAYITGIGYGTDEKAFKKFWPADVHVIGKGILRFHAVYWPAMLLSAGLKLPKLVFVHGYITIEGQKMSKSLGNIIDPASIIEKYGVDPLRYCLLSEPTFEDSDFSEKVLIAKSNNELLANIGNLVNRVMVFSQREFEGKVPKGRIREEDREFIASQKERFDRITALLEKVQLKEALHVAMSAGKEANAYFQKNKPWETAKSSRADCESAIYVLLHQVKDLAIVLAPYLPNTSAGIFEQLNLKEEKWDGIGKLSLKEGHKLGEPKILFRKIEASEIANFKAKYSGKQVEAKTNSKKKEPAKADEKNKPQADGQKKPQVAVAPINASELDLEVGKILSVERHPNAEKLYVEKIEMGHGEIRQVVSGLVPYISAEELSGKHVVIVKNLKPASLRGVQSQGMLLAAQNEKNELEVVSPTNAKAGDKVEIGGEKGKALNEISFDQFLTVKLEAKNYEAFANGKALLVNGKKIRLEKIKDGKIS